MSGGEDNIMRRLVRPDEIPMPRHLPQKVYDSLPIELRGMASYGIAEWAYNAIVEAYIKGRE